jgi:D-aminoacyl-tRNA deacylase
MRVLVQRVKRCSVKVDSKTISSIDAGLLIFLGIRNGDTEADAEYLARRCSSLRIFEDKEKKMNLSLADVNGEVMSISQFTLYGDTRKGNRPSYIEAAPPKIAEILYEHFNDSLRQLIGEKKVKTGVFRAMMDVELINDGPVTLMLDSKSNA